MSLRADPAGMERTASNVEQAGTDVVKQLQNIRQKIVEGSRSFFVAERGNALRQKSEAVFTEAITGVEQFYRSLAQGVRTEKANIEKLDS